MSFWNLDELCASLRRALDPPGSTSGLEREVALTQSATWIAVSVRQLANAGLLSGELQRHVWPARLHWPLANERPGPGDGHRYASFYELGGSRPTTLTTMRLCGMLIHSLVLAPVVAEDGRPEAVRFNTTLTRDEGLFMLEWRSLAMLVEMTCDQAVGSGVIHGA